MWHEATKPAPEHGHAADAKASHTTANTLPAYNTRRHAKEEPDRLRLALLPWSNVAPDRPAPEHPPAPQTATGDLDITGVGKLNEWNDIAGALLLLTPSFYIATPTHPILQPQYSSRWVHYRGAPGQKSLERGRLYTATDLVGFLLTQIL